MAKTGNTGTIAFTTSAFVGHFTRIGPWDPNVGDLDDSYLGTSGFKTCMPDDLKDPGEIEIEVQFDPAKDLLPLATPETVTVTYPVSVAGKTPASLVGTAYAKKGGTPEMKNGQIMVQKFQLKWDGKTGPAFTKQAA